ncbi:hypothetical protein J6590_005667 [Homalodisca vitripennis]|nr:hypothetical protein J6590_005667 [Homalodisca vitripennis]
MSNKLRAGYGLWQSGDEVPDDRGGRLGYSLNRDCAFVNDNRRVFREGKFNNVAVLSATLTVHDCRSARITTSFSACKTLLHGGMAGNQITEADRIQYPLASGAGKLHPEEIKLETYSEMKEIHQYVERSQRKSPVPRHIPL